MAKLSTLRTVYVELAFWSGLIGGSAALASGTLDATTSIDGTLRIGITIVAGVFGYLAPAFLRRSQQLNGDT